MTAKQECRVGVDIGGTGTRAISIINGQIAIAKDIPTSVLGAGTGEQRIEQLARFITDVVPEGKALTSVGVGASGPVNVESGVIHNQSTLPWFSGFPLVDPLAERLGVPIGIDNDAVAAAFGEYSLGAGHGAERLLMVTLGTGVGVAMLISGEPVRGRDGAHPEGGHIPISSEPHRCYCGLTGCWEQQASRTALQNLLSAAMDGAPASKELVANAIRRAPKDDQVLHAFHAYGAAVGRGLASLQTLYQPQTIVLGGSAANSLPLIRDEIYTAMSRSTDFRLNVELLSATLGDSAGAIGAALHIAPAQPTFSPA